MNVHLAIYDTKSSGIASAALELKPEKVILLHGKRHDVEGIKSVLNSRGIVCRSHMVSFEPEQIRTVIQHIFDENKDSNLVFNASCGYRIMVLVALQMFMDNGMESFVVDKFTNTLHWLSPNDRDAIGLGSRLKISEFLKLFSTQILSKGSNFVENHGRQELTHWLVEKIDHFGSALASLNHIAMRADLSLEFHFDKGYSRKSNLMEMLSRFQEQDLLKVFHNKVVFKDEASRFYANGGWLEDHVFMLLHEIQKNRSNISDIAKGLEVVRAKGTVKNEIDVIAMANNRLHIIECKTRRFTKRNNDNTPGSEAVYRLDSLKESLGGSSGKAMLVSYQKLSRYTLERAQDMGVYCCSHNQLKNLKEHLYRFIDSED